MTLNNITDLVPFLNGERFLHRLSPKKQAKLYQELQNKPLLLHVVKQRFGTAWTQLIAQVRYGGNDVNQQLPTQILNVHDQQFDSEREKRKIWLRDKFSFQIASNHDSKLEQLELLKSELQKYIKSHPRAGELHHYLEFFM